MNEDINNNDERALIIDVYKLLPHVARRMGILTQLQRNWNSVVNVAAKHSTPYDFIGNVLYILVEDKQTEDMISKMKGNISRALANRYDYNEAIEIKIIKSEPKHKANNKPAETKNKSKQAVIVDDSLVNKYISECPDSMTSEAKFAISHLRAYLDSLQSLRP